MEKSTHLSGDEHRVEAPNQEGDAQRTNGKKPFKTPKLERHSTIEQMTAERTFNFAMS